MTQDAGADSIQAAHTKLRQLLDRLDDLEDLRAEGDLLETVVPLLREHFDEEEAAGGLYAQVRAHGTHLDGLLHALESEHGQLLKDAELLAQEVRGLELAVRRVHTHKAALITALRRHERAENKLMLDAMSIDIGVGG